MPDRLFTYGSLMPGKQYAHLLAAAPGEWLPATVNGYVDTNGWGHSVGYPALILHEDAPPVSGMLLTSSELHKLWPQLDEYEGDAYQRVLAEVNLSDGAQVTAFVYELHQRLQVDINPLA